MAKSPKEFEKSAKDKKADKKHGAPEGSKADMAQDKRDGKYGKGMPAKPFMKNRGYRHPQRELSPRA